MYMRCKSSQLTQLQPHSPKYITNRGCNQGEKWKVKVEDTQCEKVEISDLMLPLGSSERRLPSPLELAISNLGVGHPYPQKKTSTTSSQVVKSVVA
jgi:hypothetical protein